MILGLIKVNKRRRMKLYQPNTNRTKAAAVADLNLRGLYRLGGIAALLSIMLVLADTIISFGGGDVNPEALTAIDWYTMFEGSRLMGLRMLGLINVISLTIGIPLYFCLYVTHRKEWEIFASLALILYLVGAAVYISNNAAVPMYVLSNKYALAVTNAQQALLAAAGEAIVAKGADFTPGSFVGFFFTEIAGIAFSCIMLRGSVFGKAAAYSGILGFLLLTIFTVWLTFFPVLFEAAMVVAMIGGVSTMIWNVLVARRLLNLALG